MFSTFFTGFVKYLIFLLLRFGKVDFPSFYFADIGRVMSLQYNMNLLYVKLFQGMLK